MATTTAPVLNVYLDDGGDALVVFEQQPDGRSKSRRIRAAYTTFHRTADLSHALMRNLKASAHVSALVKLTDGWTRIHWRDERARREARYQFKDLNIECFEGDVDPVMFWLVDHNVTIAKPRRCSLDFETDSRVHLSRKQDMRVLSWSVTDYQTGKTIKHVLKEDTDVDERELLQLLVNVLDDFDQVLVWEGDWKGGEFDTVIFEARTRRCGIAVDARRWVWTNQLAVWKKMNQHSAESGAEKESFKLEDIAFEQLGKGKTKAPDWVIARIGEKAKLGLGRVTWELWEAGGAFRELLLEYNGVDSEILHELEKEKGYVTLFQATCELCGIPPETRSLQPTRQMDGYLLRLGRERSHRFPTKAYREDDGADGEEEKGKFKGAVVFPPKSVPNKPKKGDTTPPWTAADAAAWRKENGFKNGILRNVHVCDFKSLYPSIMRTYNLSAEVIAGWMTERELAQKEGVLPEGMCRSPGTGLLTKVAPLGFIPAALGDLTNNRQVYADQAALLAPGTTEWVNMMAKSTSCKVTSNSFYGGGGSKFSRYNNRDVSEATTQNGVYFLRLTKDEGEKRKMVLVYGDTDSNMVVGPTEEGYRSFVGWMNKKKIPSVVAAHGCQENHVELAFEKTFERIVFVSAKAYVGRYSQYKGKISNRECHGLLRKAKDGVFAWSNDAKEIVGHEEVCPQCGTIGKLAGEPEIKGVAWKRGDKGKLTRELQGRIIDLLVGGVRLKDEHGKKHPANPGIDTPSEDLALYLKVLEVARDHVLCDPLPLAEVRLSKSLSQSLREYGKDATDAHVRVARELESRGQLMSKGVRVEYVVVDGSKSPQLVIPAEDYSGDCDRFYLWERVFEPSKALLEAAFPDEDWEKWGNVRPPTPKGRAAKIPEGQFGLALGERPKPKPVGTPIDYSELAVPGFSVRPLVVRVPEAAGTEALDRVKAVLAAHPGARRVELVIALNSGGEAILNLTNSLVSTSPKLKAAIEDAILGGDSDAP